MLLIRRYLKDRAGTIAGFGLIMLIFTVVCSLNQLPYLRQILYAAVLSTFILSSYGIYDFWKYRRHFLTLQKLALREGMAEDGGLEYLPAAKDILQEEYQNRLREMQAALRNQLAATRRKESEMMDYYLMWVHQIKTPIAALKLLAGNAAADRFQDHFQERFQDHFQIEKELFKIESYVEMVLHYLRLESISADMLVKKTAVYTVVKNAVKKYALLFIDKKIALQLQEFQFEIITDEKWFSFIIEQLLSNAVKYCINQPAEISIAMESGRLVIADTGIGINEEDLPRIFERGFTGLNGRMAQKSTGIGLYLCKQVAERLGMPLEITSVRGEGTKAVLDLTELV